ncbi:MAG: exonuclease domain-containing protein [Woeseiaceae bacterium]|nr:exonuclease domain-containing protein [Woeseiaceae bacterium]
MRRAWLSARRWWIQRRKTAPPYDELLAAPVPSSRDPVAAVEFVSLDIETTSLDAANADMLSVGWVVVRNGRVDLASAETWIVRPSGDVGDSASVHGLTDTVVGAGLDWGTVLDKIVTVLTGRVLVVHHAGLDKTLLDRMSRLRYGAPLLVPVIDTLALEHRRQKQRHHIEEGGSLKLSDLRTAYGLPRYAAHDCLVDAIATAELLLAMVAYRRAERLGDLSA